MIPYPHIRTFVCAAPRRAMLPIALTLALAGQALAADPAPGRPGVALSGTVELERTVTAAGRSGVERVKPEVVVPGNLLVFTTRYDNHTAQPVTQFVVTNPLPDAVVLESASAAAHTVSIDGGKTWGLLTALTAPDGKGGRRPAVTSDVTHIRWIVARIAPGASGEVSYRAIVR